MDLTDPSDPSNISNTTELDRMKLEWNDRLNTVRIYSILSGLGVFTNSFPIVLTFSTKIYKNNVNLMVMNMSTADFLECLVALLGQNLYVLYREILPPIGCSILGCLQLLMAVQVFFFPPFLSLNRYISLFHSHMYDRLFTLKRICMIILVTWLCSTLIPLMFLLGGQAKFDEDNQHCCIVTKGHFWWSVVYWLIIIVPLVGCCDGTMVYCNTKIFQHLRNHAATQKLDVNVVKQNREMLLFMVVDMVVPVVIHTVYHVSKFAYVDRTDLTSRRIFACLLMFNSVLRGVVTLTLLGPYRRECKRIFSAIFGKKDSKVSNAEKSMMPSTHATQTSSNVQMIHARPVSVG